MSSGGKPGAPTRMGGSGASATGSGGSSSNLPAAGSSTEIPADGAEASLVGEVLDNRYRVIKKLGEGGMGEVYAAEHIHIEKKVAIKLLRPEIVSNQEAVSRFRQEARSASSIGHRNIIGIDDFGQLKDGRIYLCMELLAGAPLNDLIKEPMAPDRLLNILIQTGHGLAAAHAKNIVHRDMKPENIFVVAGAGGEDVPKLLDFGIAKVAGQDGANNLTRTGTIFGTPFYMAPEQALGQGVDARVDVYAMGVIMYEVFAGSLPFQGESFMGILTQHITTDPEPVAQRAAKAQRNLPVGLAEVITKCLAKDPDKRFRSMDELVNALVGIYRTMVGPGMSSYMEAFAPRTGAMPAAGGAPGPHGPSAIMPQASAPTMMAGGPPPSGPMGPHSGPMGPHSGPMGGPPPGMQQPYPPVMHPPGAHTPPPYLGGPPSSGHSAYAAGGSQVMPARSSKAGLIAAIVIVLVVGGGIATFLVLGGKKKDDEAGQLAGLADGGSGGVTPPTGDIDGGGSGGVTPPPGDIDGGKAAVPPDDDLDAGGGDVAADPVDAGTAVDPPAIDGGGDVIDTVEPVTVMVVVSTRGATVYVDGKKKGKSPVNVKVKPGETHEIKVKAKGFKDDVRTIDGTDERVDISLKAVPGPGPGTGKPPAGPTKSFCEANPLDPDCAQ